MAVKIKKKAEAPEPKPKAARYVPTTAERTGEEPSAHKKLYSLGQERVDTLVSRLVAGDRFTTLARLIQNEWGELRDMQEITLIKEISRFHQRMVAGKLLYLATTEYGKMVADNFGKEVDVLENLTNLVQIQQERVTKIVERERTLPTLLNQAKLEIEQLARLYGQLAELQMDLGVTRRVPKGLIIGSVEVAASRAQEMIEDSMRKNKNVEDALARAFSFIEGEFKDVGSEDASVSGPAVR